MKSSCDGCGRPVSEVGRVRKFKKGKMYCKSCIEIVKKYKK
jgi:formylmethanofuran dehydrogenase subunit E